MTEEQKKPSGSSYTKPELDFEPSAGKGRYQKKKKYTGPEEGEKPQAKPAPSDQPQKEQRPQGDRPQTARQQPKKAGDNYQGDFQQAAESSDRGNYRGGRGGRGDRGNRGNRGNRGDRGGRGGGRGGYQGDKPYDSDKAEGAPRGKRYQKGPVGEGHKKPPGEGQPREVIKEEEEEKKVEQVVTKAQTEPVPVVEKIAEEVVEKKTEEVKAPAKKQQQKQRPQTAKTQPKQEETKGEENPFAALVAQNKKESTFAKAPVASSGAKPQQQQQQQQQITKSTAKMPQGKPVNVVSNQYRLNVGQNLQVYQYVLAVEPMAFWDAHRVQAIIRTKRREMEAALGPFVCSGQSIYTLSEIDDSMKFTTNYQKQDHDIHVDKGSMTKVSMASKDMPIDSQSVMYQLLNIIIKQAFRETSLKQVGKAPRFFDVEHPVVIHAAGLQIWTGFKAAAVQSKLGTMLCMDSIFKFMCTRSCLDTIDDMKKRAKDAKSFQAAVRTEYNGQVIIANWGNRRSYTVNDIDFENSPETMTFQFQDKEISVAQYFQLHYNMKLSRPKQPLFSIKIGENNFYLPPEFCLVDGVTEDIRKSQGMRDALKATRIDPSEKVSRIQKMCKDLFSQKCITDWGLQIEVEPVRMKTEVLPAPLIFKQKQVIHCDEQVLRKLPIQRAVDLPDDSWLLIYARRNFDQANAVFDTMARSCGQLGIKIGNPFWIELESEHDMGELESWVLEYLIGGDGKEFRHPTISLAVLGMEKNYPMYKLLFDKYRMPSQVVTARNARGFNASKASNIIRQMNSKSGGDLFTMKFPDVLSTMKTMLIGIDVCHAGRKSVVGFAASTNKHMSQYFSDYIVQPKGQEIVKDKMISLIRRAIHSFEQKNKSKPTNFIIYRDGVGDSMREQVLANEIPQLKAVISDLYNEVAQQPAITVVVVNKRITQRFFVEEGKRLVNPPSGCIIDKELVEKDGSDKNGIFDFYLTPANTTQGCVLPTHFFVAMNQSKINKLELEHLTFALCHFYFNWAGPIKVPAPCQYAHKIAEFYTRVGLESHDKQRKGGKKPLDKREADARQKCEKVIPLNEKLHFL